jgi:cytochrome P450
MNLAIMEVAIGLSALLYRFNFNLVCSPNDIQRVFNFTAQPNKMPVFISKRSV